MAIINLEFSVLFFDQQTVDAVSDVFELTSEEIKYFIVAGVFAGATIDVEIQTQGSSLEWAPVEGGDFTFPLSRAMIPIRKFTKLRVVLANAGPLTNITVEMTK